MESGVDRRVRVFSSLATLSSGAARHVAERARDAVAARGRFTWVLAGGHTPEGLYRKLAERYQTDFPWRESEVFFGDERCVPAGSPLSNYSMARDALLRHVPIPAGRVHRLRGEVRPPSEAAATYRRLLDRLALRGDGTGVRFDLVVLGIGPDGHTASLFPGSSALRERQRTVVALRRSGQPPWVPRLTLTLPAFASSREVLFLVAGEEKADVVARVLRARPPGNPNLPASRIRSAGSVRWFLNRSAASHLSKGLLSS
ncbi:MAG: 6-phosphogluconolactonase [Thermoplasmata archaeon]|nr:6-phosphogluconolactonase [Thermoplasmata archaeon]